MKAYLPILLIVIVCGLSCKKETALPTELPFINKHFKISDLETPLDVHQVDIVDSNTFILYADSTWHLNFDGAIAKGRYSWIDRTNTLVDSVTFSIIEWNYPLNNVDLSSKLKSVFENNARGICSLVYDRIYLVFSDYDGNYSFRAADK